ncbi:MAG: hypothetical protein FJZ95_10515 [Chloroflexi bacterium]|nr:hypothetical protein [Chloroflexota bacterium]
MKKPVRRGKTLICRLDPAEWATRMQGKQEGALSNLPQMASMEMQITALDTAFIPVAEAIELVGGPKKQVVAASLELAGAAPDQILLVYPAPVTLGLADMLKRCPDGTTSALGQLETSIVSEISPTTGRLFLVSTSDDTRLRIGTTTPGTRIRMATAVFEIARAEMMQGRDGVFIMAILFATDFRSLVGTVLIVTTAGLADALTKRKGHGGRRPAE